AERGARRFDLISCLQVEPEFWRGTEELAQPKGGIRRDAGFFPRDALDPRSRQLAGARQGIGGKFERLHELLAEHLAGMQRRKTASGHDSSLSRAEVGD